VSEVSEAAQIARGRQVYIAEGCIHCHSQYIRAGSWDEVPWGPARALDRSQRPPLPGNRRQGPDLSAVGLRRSAVWQRLHLENPRRLMPPSVMPSYAHLFEDERGEALVAYLNSLGRGGEEERWRLVQDASFGSLDGGSATRGEILFGRYCAVCHGAEGTGD